MHHQFTNDYNRLTHPEILKAIIKANEEQNIGYGLDKHSKNAERLILNRFGVKEGSCYFLAGGTQSNMVVISYLLKPYEAVIACDTGHINVHETGAVEASGHKVLTYPNKDGKLTSEGVISVVNSHPDMHMVKPKMVYISNSTELGTVYSKKELTELRKVCDKYDLYLFIDGARLGTALTSKGNDVTPEFLGKVSDVFYIGGTKNGMMLGEAIVFKDKMLAKEFRYHIKNKGAMLAKGFLPAVMFERAFQDNLYFDMANNANVMAEYIVKGLKGVVEFSTKSVTNQQFIRVKKEDAKNLTKTFGLELWSDGGNKQVLRIVTDFATTKEDCLDLVNYIKELCK